MNKKSITAILLTIAAIALFLIIKNNIMPVENIFNGSRIRNPDGYYLDFDYMNQEDSCDLTVGAGDNLHVSFDITKGDVSLVVETKSGSRFYQGDGIQQGEFELTVPDDSGVTVRVVAKKAKGKISVVYDK